MKKGIVEERAEILDQAAYDWMQNPKGSLSSLLIRKTRKFSKDPALNLAAWMMHNFGPCLHGETEASWIEIAKEVMKIIR